MTTGYPASQILKEQILAVRGQMKTRDIAELFGVTVGVVAGICFRADHGNRRMPRRFLNAHIEQLERQQP